MLINKVSDDACQWMVMMQHFISIGVIILMERFVCCMTHNEKLRIQY